MDAPVIILICKLSLSRWSYAKPLTLFLYCIFSAPVHRQKHSLVILFLKVLSVKSLSPLMGRRCVLLPYICPPVNREDQLLCSHGILWRAWANSSGWCEGEGTPQLFSWKLSFFSLSHKLSLFLIGISVGYDLFCFGSSLSQTKQWICPQHKKCWIISVPCCSLCDEYGNIQFQVT